MDGARSIPISCSDEKSLMALRQMTASADITSSQRIFVGRGPSQASFLRRALFTRRMMPYVHATKLKHEMVIASAHSPLITGSTT
eukprot:6179354-Pleurochrysis_carterae.AAC.1